MVVETETSGTELGDEALHMVVVRRDLLPPLTKSSTMEVQSRPMANRMAFTRCAVYETCCGSCSWLFACRNDVTLRADLTVSYESSDTVDTWEGRVQ